jgi:ferredoxin
MAIIDKKVAPNVGGKIYVDSTCIDCDLCRAEVPEVFARHDDGFSYVYAQPQSDEVLEKTKEVIGNCPVESIGADGDKNEEKADEQTA